jgi:hypothetical protein
MAALSTFGEATFAAPHHAFDQDTLQDVALACVEGASDDALFPVISSTDHWLIARVSLLYSRAR